MTVRSRRTVGGKNIPSLGSRVPSTRSSALEHNRRRRREHSPITMDLTTCLKWTSPGRGTRTRCRTDRTTRCSDSTSSRTRLSCAMDSVGSNGRAQRVLSAAAVDSVSGDARYQSQLRGEHRSVCAHHIYAARV